MESTMMVEHQSGGQYDTTILKLLVNFLMQVLI